MKLSLVVPCYNESGSVHLFLDAVIGDFEGCGYDYEVIFVNDGSRDNTLFRPASPRMMARFRSM